MPLTGAQMRTQLADTARNPRKTIGTGSATSPARGVVVFVTLQLDGVQYRAEDLYDALVTLYGSGKVTSPKDTADAFRPVFTIKA